MADQPRNMLKRKHAATLPFKAQPLPVPGPSSSGSSSSRAGAGNGNSRRAGSSRRGDNPITRQNQFSSHLESAARQPTRWFKFFDQAIAGTSLSTKHFASRRRMPHPDNVRELQLDTIAFADWPENNAAARATWMKNMDTTFNPEDLKTEMYVVQPPDFALPMFEEGDDAAAGSSSSDAPLVPAPAKHVLMPKWMYDITAGRRPTKVIRKMSRMVEANFPVDDPKSLYVPQPNDRVVTTKARDINAGPKLDRLPPIYPEEPAARARSTSVSTIQVDGEGADDEGTSQGTGRRMSVGSQASSAVEVRFVDSSVVTATEEAGSPVTPTAAETSTESVSAATASTETIPEPIEASAPQPSTPEPVRPAVAVASVEARASTNDEEIEFVFEEEQPVVEVRQEDLVDPPDDTRATRMNWSRFVSRGDLFFVSGASKVNDVELKLNEIPVAGPSGIPKKPTPPIPEFQSAPPVNQNKGKPGKRATKAHEAGSPANSTKSSGPASSPASSKQAGKGKQVVGKQGGSSYPLKTGHICWNCGESETTKWQKFNGEVACNKCYNKLYRQAKKEAAIAAANPDEDDKEDAPSAKGNGQGGKRKGGPGRKPSRSLPLPARDQIEQDTFFQGGEDVEDGGKIIYEGRGVSRGKRVNYHVVLTIPVLDGPPALAPLTIPAVANLRERGLSPDSIVADEPRRRPLSPKTEPNGETTEGRRTSTNRKRSRSDAENLQELASATNNKRNKPLLGTPPEGARDSEHTEGLILLYEAIQDHPEQELDPVITSPVQSSKRPSTGNMDDTEDELTVDSGASLKKDVEVVDSGVVAKRKPSKAILEGYGGPKTLGFTPNNPAVKSRKTARTSAPAVMTPMADEDPLTA